jgi:hypothetical protein
MCRIVTTFTVSVLVSSSVLASKRIEQINSAFPTGNNVVSMQLATQTQPPSPTQKRLSLACVNAALARHAWQMRSVSVQYWVEEAG